MSSHSLPAFNSRDLAWEKNKIVVWNAFWPIEFPVAIK